MGFYLKTSLWFYLTCNCALAKCLTYSTCICLIFNKNIFQVYCRWIAVSSDVFLFPFISAWPALTQLTDNCRNTNNSCPSHLPTAACVGCACPSPLSPRGSYWSIAIAEAQVPFSSVFETRGMGFGGLTPVPGQLNGPAQPLAWRFSPSTCLIGWGQGGDTDPVHWWT